MGPLLGPSALLGHLLVLSFSPDSTSGCRFYDSLVVRMSKSAQAKREPSRTDLPTTEVFTKLVLFNVAFAPYTCPASLEERSSRSSRERGRRTVLQDRALAVFHRF